MAEEYETTTPRPSAAGDFHEELESGKTYARQADKHRKSAAGAVAEESRKKVEKIWSDAKDRARSLQEDGEKYVRKSPTKAVFTALGIGFVLGLIFRH